MLSKYFTANRNNIFLRNSYYKFIINSILVIFAYLRWASTKYISRSGAAWRGTEFAVRRAMEQPSLANFALRPRRSALPYTFWHKSLFNKFHLLEFLIQLIKLIQFFLLSRKHYVTLRGFSSNPYTPPDIQLSMVAKGTVFWITPETSPLSPGNTRITTHKLKLEINPSKSQRTIFLQSLFWRRYQEFQRPQDIIMHNQRIKLSKTEPKDKVSAAIITRNY